MLVTYSTASAPGTLELSPPSKPAPPLSETASATPPGRPPDARHDALGLVGADEARGRDAAVGLVVVVVKRRASEAAEQLVRVDERAAAHGDDRAAARRARAL